MQWLIQNSGMTFNALDRNLEPLIRALDEKGIEKHAVGIIPSREDGPWDTIVGLEGIDRTKPTMFYGSTRLAELAAKSEFFPNLFYRPEWFDPFNWIGKRNDLLNEEQVKITAGQLRRDWIGQPMFVKSVAPKVLTGMVLEGPDRGWWTDEYELAVPDDTELVLSPVQAIVREWRTFIVNGKVVAASQYKHDGILRMREPIPPEVWCRFVWKAESRWLPAPNIVMDVCELASGEFMVVEFNSLVSSGFYNADAGAIVEAIMAHGLEAVS